MLDYLESDFPKELWMPFVSNPAVVSWKSGQLIYQQESQANCFYYLKSGKVKSFIQSEQGQERVLHIYQSGALFGMASFFDELPRVSSAVALEPCEVLYIDKSSVGTAFAKDPKLAFSMMKYLAKTVRLLSHQVDDMAFRPAPQRVARYLLQHSDKDGCVAVTQDEIADSVSVSRVTVSRVLKKFTEQGWLETKYGQILLKNPLDLEQFSTQALPEN